MQTEPTVSSAWFPGQDRSKFALFLRKVATLVHRNTSVTEANLKTGPKLKPIWSCRLDLPSAGWPTDMVGLLSRVQHHVWDEGLQGDRAACPAQLVRVDTARVALLPMYSSCRGCCELPKSGQPRYVWGCPAYCTAVEDVFCPCCEDSYNMYKAPCIVYCTAVEDVFCPCCVDSYEMYGGTLKVEQMCFVRVVWTAITCTGLPCR